MTDTGTCLLPLTHGAVTYRSLLLSTHPGFMSLLRGNNTRKTNSVKSHGDDYGKDMQNKARQTLKCRL